MVGAAAAVPPSWVTHKVINVIYMSGGRGARAPGASGERFSSSGSLVLCISVWTHSSVCARAEGSELRTLYSPIGFVNGWTLWLPIFHAFWRSGFLWFCLWNEVVRYAYIFQDLYMYYGNRKAGKVSSFSISFLNRYFYIHCFWFWLIDQCNTCVTFVTALGCKRTKNSDY